MAGIEAERRFYTNVSTVMYTLSHRGLSKTKYVYRVIHRYFDVSESYIIFYGYPRPKVSPPIPLYLLDPPYSRGKLFVVGAKLVQNPVILYINLDSNCLKEDLLIDAVEGIIDGHFQLYFTVPLSTPEFLEAYRASVYGMIKEFKPLENLQYPSYTIAIGKRKLFLTADYTPWSIEPLIALDTPMELVRIRNDTCIDAIPEEVRGFGKIFMDILAKKLTLKLASRGMLKQSK